MYLNIILRSIFSFLFLQILAKWGGPKQLSQLTYYDYIVGITVGNLAGAWAINVDIPWYYCALSMVIYIGLTVLQSLLTMKSLKLRKALTGTPVFLIHHGKIIEKNLKKIRFDINDFLSECRSQGQFDISMIEFAVMETSGKISLLLKSEENPITFKGMNKNIIQEEISANVVIDGKIMEKELRMIGKDAYWLKDKLKDEDISNLLLVIADRNNQIQYFYKNETLKHANYYM